MMRQMRLTSMTMMTNLNNMDSTGVKGARKEMALGHIPLMISIHTICTSGQNRDQQTRNKLIM